MGLPAPAETPQAKERLMSAIRSLGGLARVEALVKSKFASDSPLLEEIPRYLLGLGGKRMRPILTLMTSHAFGMTVIHDDVIDVASGIELIHMATLLHDDIIDKSPLRRHQMSPLVKFGASETLLSGDFLLVRAFSLCAHLDEFIVNETEKACLELVEGEVMEVSLAERSQTLESALDISRRKTASLFRLATTCAGFLCRLNGRVAQNLSAFGENLGITFQILDDILDVASDEDLLGKKTGMDLREKKPSVVNVLWLQSRNGLAERILTKPGEVPESLVEQAIQELRSGPVLAKARELALQYAERTSMALDTAVRLAGVTDPEWVDGLRALVDYTVERTG